jgi:hypothetical protein
MQTKPKLGLLFTNPKLNYKSVTEWEKVTLFRMVACSALMYLHLSSLQQHYSDLANLAAAYQ